MGGHAKRHWGNPLLDKKDYRTVLAQGKEIAEEELKELDE